MILACCDVTMVLQLTYELPWRIIKHVWLMLMGARIREIMSPNEKRKNLNLYYYRIMWMMPNNYLMMNFWNVTLVVCIAIIIALSYIYLFNKLFKLKNSVKQFYFF